MVLAWPSRPVSTAAVFTALESASNAPLCGFDPDRLADIMSVVAFLDETRNDLTGPAVAIEPAIADVLDALDARQGCLLSRMSGSGSTCFGLFADKAGASAAAAAISQDHPGWWVRSTLAR
jgi:4-diphosphocytidyl-2-C-methyl-D-erythritol kinase